MSDDTFEKRHARVDADPVVELRRRLSIWASAPPSRGVDLDAAIIPRATIIAAIDEITSLRTARSAALEEAARVAEKHQNVVSDYIGGKLVNGGTWIAHHIRALKDKDTRTPTEGDLL